MSQEDNAPVRLLNHHELMLTLQGLCKEQRSGVMVINSESGDTAKIVLEQGMIFDVFFGEVSGTTAILLIKKIKQGKAVFLKPTQGSAIKHINLSTDVILRLLAVAESTQTTEPPPATPLPTPTPTPVINQAQVTSEENLTVIEAVLATIIGPVAGVIYSRYAEEIQQMQDLTALATVVEKIAKQVLSAEQQKMFKARLRDIINRCGLKEQKAVLNILKSAGKELKLQPTTLSLCISKNAAQGTLGATLLAKLVLQIETAGNLAEVVKLPDMLKFLEKTTETGLLAIEAKGKKAGFYFDKGVLVNAFQSENLGGKAVLELLQWELDKMIFVKLAQTGVTRDIHQTVEDLIKQARSFHNIISKEEGQQYTRTDAADSVQLALAKEIERLQAKAANKTEGSKPNMIDPLIITKAIHLAKSYDPINAERLLCTVLMEQDNNYLAWFWLARVLTNMTAIEFALKKAAYIDSKSSELIEEVKKFTLARKVLKSDFVLRCPFCWMPVKEKANECPNCKANFFMDNAFFSKVGKAKIDVLDEVIARYNQELQQNSADSNTLYLHFYLAMAYLNRGYYQEGLEQLEEVVIAVPENKALIQQKALLTRYMQSVGLISTATQQTNQNEALTKGKILVVEDSMVTRKVIARTLTANGYEVLEAKNADEALADIEARNPKLVLLDIILPGRDGYEILAEIKKIPRLAKIPVIMLTSRDSLFDKIKGKVSDADEYLTKPFQPDELLMIVKKYLK